MRAYQVDDVRTAENAVLATVADGALMQRAAAALAVSCARVLRGTGSKRVTGRRVVLLVGTGDNGGDALFAGARLVGRGAQVTAVMAGDRAHPGGLTAVLAAGGIVVSAAEQGLEAGVAALARADLVLDGLVGLSARPGLRESAAALVAAIPHRAVVVAVDLPSGVDPETGELPGPHVTAARTVTFGAAKPCLLLPPASVAAGVVELVDLGLGPHLPDEPQVQRLTSADVARLWPVPAAGADKYRRGVLGVVSGSAGYPGAAVLSVSGALRAGLGMVRYLGPPDATAAVLAAWPEVVAGTGRVQAWLLGPGVAPDAQDDQAAAIGKALDAGEPCVLDAGAITLFARRGVFDRSAHSAPSAQSAHSAQSAQLLLTPHAGELARLLTDLGGKTERDDVERQPYRHARRAAELTGATVLLKGSTTLVVRPDGVARSQAEAPSWLATAGAGDVLAGIAGALMSGGLSPFDAGSIAALVHGRAATAASGGGPIVSADVAAHVPAVVAALLSRSALRS